MEQGVINVGFASRVFTPDRPAMLQGQMYVRVAREALDPLALTAMAVEGDGATGKIIIISCDLPMIPDALQSEVRKRIVSRIPLLPPESVIMTATHTHDAPVIVDGFYPHPGGDVMMPSECMELVISRAVEAAVSAWQDRVPRLTGCAFGHAVVGHNRRAVYGAGRALMYGKTDTPDFLHIEGYEDHSIDIIFIWEPGGPLAGIVLDIPCPSQVDEHLHSFSADYWHEIRLELRRRFGQSLHVLPLCGAAGDQSPHFLLYARQESEMRRRRGLSERQEIAARIGDAVERALLCTNPESPGTFVAHQWMNLQLSARHITGDERDWAESARAEAIGRGDNPGLWWPMMLGDVVSRFDRGESMPPMTVELHAIRLGDAVIVTNPFELFIDYGLRIKARSQAGQTIVVQLAGGRGFYLPTERAVRGGHYGAHPVVAPVGPEGGAELVEATLGMIAALFTDSQARKG